MTGQKVANNPLGSYPVLVSRTAVGENIQHVRLDFGSGATESQVTAANPLPVTMSGGGGATDITAVGGEAIPAEGGLYFVGAKGVPIMATDGSQWKIPVTNVSGNLIAEIKSTQTYPFSTDETYDGSLGEVTKTGIYTGADWKVWDGSVTTGIGSVVENTPAYGFQSGTITASAQTIVLSDIRAFASVNIMITGTYNGINLTPEISLDNTNWSTVSISRQATPQVLQSTGALTNTTASYVAPTLGARYFRVRSTAWVSGTMTVNLLANVGSCLTAVVAIPTGTTAISGSLTTAGTATPIPATAQGASSHYRNLDLNDTGVAVKGSATVVSSIEATNTTGAMIYLKIYNQVAAPTSANTPVKTIGLNPTATTPIACGAFGWRFATGFGVRCVTGIADANTTNPAANGCILNATYT